MRIRFGAPARQGPQHSRDLCDIDLTKGVVAGLLLLAVCSVPVGALGSQVPSLDRSATFEVSSLKLENHAFAASSFTLPPANGASATPPENALQRPCEPVRLGGTHRQFPQKHRIERAEDRGSHADARGQRQHGNRCTPQGCLPAPGPRSMRGTIWV